MKIIDSKKINGMFWMIETNELSKEDIEYIENLDLTLNFDYTTHSHWARCIKLPSKKWLKDIEINFEVTVARAVIS